MTDIRNYNSHINLQYLHDKARITWLVLQGWYNRVGVTSLRYQGWYNIVDITRLIS